MWTLALSPLELVVRAAVVYAVFLAALRLSGKRELGQFTIFDLAVVLLASNALQPAITGPDASIPGGLIVVVTLFTLNHVVAYGRVHSRRLRTILDYAPSVIARDGQWDQAMIDREDLLDDDLDAAIRDHGLDSIKDVKLAVLEHDGSISVVPTDGDRISMRSGRRRYRRRARD